MSERLTIVHQPTGTDAPYTAGLDERLPRDPIGGDMVSIGFLTQPGYVTQDVRLHWRRNGRVQSPIQGRAVSQGTDADRWLGELGVLEAGDMIEYWMIARGDGQYVETPHYCFQVRRQRRLAGITAVVNADAQSWTLATCADDRQPGPSITVTLIQDAHTIQMTVGGLVTAAAPTSIDELISVQGVGGALEIDTVHGRFALVTDAGRVPLRLRWLEEGDGQIVAVEIVGALADDEALVGFGERFDALNQRGRALDVTVWEQYKNQGNRTYLPIPFFYSSQGYGCLVEGSAHVTYDIGRMIDDRWRCLAQVDENQHVTIDLFTGTPLQVLHLFTALTGRPETLPDWAFGPWMSSNEWNSQERVEYEVALTQQHEIPATALVIEAWSDETTFYIWNGAQYQPRTGKYRPSLADFQFAPDGPWPDPKGMTERLHAMGIRLLLWQIPVLKQIEETHPQHDADVAHALEQGYIVHHRDGRPYRNPAFWFRGALIPDFTSAEATRWWLDKRAYLLDELGIDGFKTDGGEHLQGRDIIAADGRQGHQLVNAYPNLYIGAYHRFARERHNAITFSRAGHTSAGAFPAHWAGDENSTWEAYRRSIVAGLSAAMSGVLFWGWDIAGFSEALPSAELYLRATAMAAFCPIMQYHSEYTPPGTPSKDRTPWNIQATTGDQRVIPLYRVFAQLRMQLLPYICAEAAYSAATGEPLMRPLLLDSADDPIAWAITDQYCFGRDLLVAPVVEEGVTRRRLYLPCGEWRDFWDGTRSNGGQWIIVDAPLERIPVFVRMGAAFQLKGS